jgi:predicted ATP-dependent serine protease
MFLREKAKLFCELLKIYWSFMRPTSGLQDLDEILFVEGEPLVIYGEPASGKTNLVLKILRESLRSSMSAAYISTEGSIVVERMDRLGMLDFPELYIGFAYSLAHLAQLVFEASALEYNIVAIDSVNSPYRSSVGSVKRASEIFLGILAAMKIASMSGKWVIATAQVRDVEEDIEPSGSDLISFYCNNIARIRRSAKNRRVLEVRGRKYSIKILERDILISRL